MKCSVYIATSVDGYIATPTGGVDWLHQVGDSQADMGAHADMGFSQFIDSVDCIIMGRKCMEVVSAMQLTPEQWPYKKLPLIVLSKTLTRLPDNMPEQVELYDGDINDLVKSLEQRGLSHAYVDGGATITSFLRAQLIDQMIITKAPILLGEGAPLFGYLPTSIELTNASSIAFPNHFVQLKYDVKY